MEIQLIDKFDASERHARFVILFQCIYTYCFVNNQTLIKKTKCLFIHYFISGNTLQIKTNVCQKKINIVKKLENYTAIELTTVRGLIGPVQLLLPASPTTGLPERTANNK